MMTGSVRTFSNSSKMEEALYKGSGLTPAKNRFSGGAELKINRHNSIELEYIFQRNYLPHISDENIISVNYKLRF